MVITLSSEERNGNECHQSLEYGLLMSALKNKQGVEPSMSFEKLREKALKELKIAQKILDDCQIPKYISIRQSTVDKWNQILFLLKRVE